MKRSISTLLTTLLFSAAIMPNAMAQMQNPVSPADSSIGSMDVPDQPAVDSTKPTSPKTDVVPAPSQSSTPSASSFSSETARPSVDRPNVDRSSPAYCPSLPSGTNPGDWEYREALYKCLYGS